MQQRPIEFPLAVWCDRSPRIRWTLVVLLLLALWGLAGGIDCGLWP